MKPMNWSDLFPVLDDDLVSHYQNEASQDEQASLGEHFEIEEVFNRRAAEHVVSTSLFWKPIRQEEAEYPLPSREVMQAPHAHGLSSRFVNPWDHYVLPLLETAQVLRTKRPNITLRVYLARDLAFLVDELMAVGCEVYLMRSSSLRHNPGAMWRFLAMAVQVVSMEGPFSKGRGLNAAVKAAQSDHLLLLDADMLVSEGAFLAGLDSLSKGRAFFPIIMGLDQDGNDVGWWGEGTGIAFVPKTVFPQVGGIAEFQSWGGEDDLFYEAVTSLIPIDRGKIEGMVHQWHPDHCRHEHDTGAKWEDFDKVTR